MNKRATKTIIFFLFLILNLYLAVTIFGTFDVRAWIRSAGLTNDYGLIKGFEIYNMYYPPLSSLILWVVGKISNIRSLPAWINEYPTAAEVGLSYIPIKLSLVLFLYLIPTTIYFYERFLKKHKTESWFSKSAYIFANPIFILSISVLGYLDIFFAPFLLLSFIFLERKRFYLSGLLLSIAFSIKLIPIFAIPIFLSYFATLDYIKPRLRIDWINAQRFLFGIATTVLSLIYFFGYESILAIFKASAAHGANLSNNAANLNLLISIFIGSNTAPDMWILLSRGVFYLICGIVTVKIILSTKKLEPILFSSILIFYTYFIFFTGAHENHLFPALIAAVSYFVILPNPTSKKILMHTSLLLALNLFIYYWLGHIVRNGSFVLIGPQNGPILTKAVSPLISLYSLFIYGYLIKTSFGGAQNHTHTGK
jgi:hypothetical protein